MKWYAAAILFCAIFVTALRCRGYRSFTEWWESEGCPLWIMVGILVGSALVW